MSYTSEKWKWISIVSHRENSPIDILLRFANTLNYKFKGKSCLCFEVDNYFIRMLSKPEICNFFSYLQMMDSMQEWTRHDFKAFDKEI